MLGFERKRDSEDMFNVGLSSLEALTPKQTTKLNNINRYWNFYEGFHWEDLGDSDSPEVTVNYCRAFINKYVAFELGKAFTMDVSKAMKEEGVTVTEDGRTLFEYLEDVWEDNHQHKFCSDMGQMKSVTGEAWIQVVFEDADEIDDPFGEYENGRLRLILHPTSIVFPEYDVHDKEKLVRVTLMYSYEKEVKTGFLRANKLETHVYKQIWDSEKCVVIDGKEEPEEFPNNYGIIPFVQINNLNISARVQGVSDLEDLIPLNTELNLKKSNVSEILDYHAAPVTVVFGAKVGNLEKGANKIWGGLPTDARVDNLELSGDLSTSTNYIDGLKTSMCEVGGIPEAVLGGSVGISNTSGIALQYLNLPLIEKTRLKRLNTEDGLERLNKIILLVSLVEKVIKIPEGVQRRDFFYNTCKLSETLPKDDLLELQQLQAEISMAIESRLGAMKRRGIEEAEDKLREIDKDRKTNPEAYGLTPQAVVEQPPQINSGMTNGETPVEVVRKEMTGQNGGEEQLQ